MTNIKEESKNNYKQSYKATSFRLHNGTLASLKQLKGDVSWNKFFLSIIKEYENRN